MINPSFIDELDRPSSFDLLGDAGECLSVVGSDSTGLNTTLDLRASADFLIVIES